jgi:hypothetical protein
MKRHKEFFPDGLELSPIRLLGGFICADTHIGCFGCTYCLNRRDPLLHRILNENTHVDLHQIGLSLDALFDIISSLPSYKRARVPIRFGHLTDWKYEEKEMSDLYSMIPKDYACVMLTRFPLSSFQRNIFTGQKNLLLHISLTPLIKRYERDFVDPVEVITSASGIPAEQVLFMLRPLVKGHQKAVIELLDLLPSFTNVALRGMSTDNIPGIGDLNKIPGDEISEVKAYAKERNLQVWDFFGCVLRKNLNIPFFKFLEARNVPNSACHDCSNESICRNASKNFDPKILEEMLDELKITFNEIQQFEDRILVSTSVPTARAEEIFLSELTNRDIRFSSVSRSQKSGVLTTDSQIFERWQQTGFFPINTLREISTILLKFIGS